jgi:hypothetical protein
MIDIETQAPLKINTDGDAGPYLMVPLNQLPEVRRVLEHNGIKHVIEDDAIQWDDKPVIAIVDFDYRADVAKIQAALDAA